MTQKIGVISPELPTRYSLPKSLRQPGMLLWFNEIEACFAYLLTEQLQKLYIDEAMFHNGPAYMKRYQRLMEQLHPNLSIGLFSPIEIGQKEPNNPYQMHFPKLDALFKDGELKTVFQPIVRAEAQGLSIHGVECLSRFSYRGHVYAPEFIFNYASERLKQTTCDKMCMMQALELLPCKSEKPVFLNVRPQTLVSGNFILWFKELLKKHKLLPQQVVMELTEQYCNISEAEMIERCLIIQGMGVRLAIDDFGSGLSNLSMLEVIKPSYLKISGRFIRNVGIDVNKQKIVKNILDLAHAFGITPIVENVETEDEWQMISQLGACLAQGFHFFKPMNSEDFLALLNEMQMTIEPCDHE